MSQIDYFRRQAADCRKALHYAETHPGFALKEVLSDGFERDITEQHKQGLRAAIIEYEKCIAYLEQHAVGQAERLPQGAADTPLRRVFASTLSVCVAFALRLRRSRAVR
jgi:hypothetical protein